MIAPMVAKLIDNLSPPTLIMLGDHLALLEDIEIFTFSSGH